MPKAGERTKTQRFKKKGVLEKLHKDIGGLYRATADMAYMNKLRTYEGGCHCERVRFRVTADLDTVILCNFSICTKKGIIHLIVPPERFELLCGNDDLTTYTFNTGVAKHTFCKHCGIHPFYVPRSDPDKIDVNARCIDDIDLTTLEPTHFDGRHWE